MLSKSWFTIRTTMFISGIALLLTGCGAPITQKVPAPNVTPPPAAEQTKQPDQTQQQPEQTEQPEPKKTVDQAAFTTPDSATVLVNKQYGLPQNYKPSDLVDDPGIPFLFQGKDEKRLLRKIAAEPLKKMFAAAKQEGLYLVGVSAFRSYETQKGLFNSYVQTQGETEARRYSAVPGFSEHQTGLSIDVSGSTGVCAVENCFADTPEAKWLAQHAQEYGYIIRYPQGKEAITGYAYESWHIRYVGAEVAKEIYDQNITFEEYVQNVVPALKTTK